jgi:hypothetical protein
MLGSKLHFLRHVDYLHSQRLNLLGLIRFVTYNLSSLDSSKVLCVTSVHSKLEYTSVVWYNLILADSNKLENIQRKFTNLCYSRLIQPNSFCNYESMSTYLYYKKPYSRRQNLHLNSLLTFSRTKLTVVLIWIHLVSVYPLSRLDTFPPLTSEMFQHLVLQQGASRLQTTSADLWTFSINITSPLRIHFLLLNPELPLSSYLYYSVA